MAPLGPGGVAATVLAAFLAAFVQGLTGFGSALVAMPLLVFAIGVRAAAPLVALLSLVINAALLLPARRRLPWRRAVPLLAGAALGVPAGVLFLAGAREGAVRIALGVVLAASAALLGSSRIAVPAGWEPAFAAGGLSGLLGGAFNTGGPPVLVYAASQRWPKAETHATIQLYSLLSGLAIVGLHAGTGLTTGATLAGAALALPALAAGAAAGWAVHRRLGEGRFRTLLRLALAAAGFALLLPSAR